MFITDSTSDSAIGMGWLPVTTYNYFFKVLVSKPAQKIIVLLLQLKCPSRDHEKEVPE